MENISVLRSSRDLRDGRVAETVTDEACFWLLKGYVLPDPGVPCRDFDGARVGGYENGWESQRGEDEKDKLGYPHAERETSFFFFFSHLMLLNRPYSAQNSPVAFYAQQSMRKEQ